MYSLFWHVNLEKMKQQCFIVPNNNWSHGLLNITTYGMLVIFWCLWNVFKIITCPCEKFFLQLPHDVYFFSQNENSNIEQFFKIKGNAHVKPSSICRKNYNQIFEALWKMGKKWLMHLKPKDGPPNIGFMECVACV
jgi:hypothetical protein